MKRDPRETWRDLFVRAGRLDGGGPAREVLEDLRRFCRDDDLSSQTDPVALGRMDGRRQVWAFVVGRLGGREVVHGGGASGPAMPATAPIEGDVD